MGGAPQAPDPYQTADAQAKANKESAVASQELGMVNQVTPTGSLTYQQTGTSASGTPTYTATTKLSDAQQGLLDQQQGIARIVNEIAGTQASKIGDLLSTPLNINNEATEARLMDLGRKRLDPYFDQKQSALTNDLANKGIAIGTPAYSRAMADFSQGRNDAYDNLALTGRQQAVAEAMAERNQPINEITALLSGGQVSSPNFVNTPKANVAAPDIQGLVNENYKSQVAQYNSQMGGLFGLGSALLGGLTRIGGSSLPSDERLKADIRPIGRADNGLTIYAYRFHGSPRTEIGLLAQEVEKVRPHAVMEDPATGFKLVNYDLATREE